MLRDRYQDLNIYFPERLARICNDMGVKNFLHVSALQQNSEHRSEWARTKVGLFLLFLMILMISCPRPRERR